MLLGSNDTSRVLQNPAVDAGTTHPPKSLRGQMHLVLSAQSEIANGRSTPLWLDTKRQMFIFGWFISAEIKRIGMKKKPEITS